MNRILQINAGSDSFNSNSINFGGVENFIINIFRNINREKYVFDFLTVGKTTYGKYFNELKSAGANIYELKVVNNKVLRLMHFFIRLVIFLRNHKYKVAHIHTGALYLQTVSVLACYFARIPNIISHSHGSKKYNSLLSKLCKRIVSALSTDKISCSLNACKSIFDSDTINRKKVKIINNGIDVKKYSFSEKARNKYRKQIGLENKFVVGHVGNFYEPKNHLLLINIFYELQKIKKDSFLVLIGDGILRKRIENLINSLGMKDKVLLLGHRDDIPELLSSMDVFVFPSVHEGFPLTLLEAQASGLKCYISDSITREIDITDLVCRNNINLDPKLWAENVLNNYKICERSEYNKELIDKGYGLSRTASDIQNIYEKIHF